MSDLTACLHAVSNTISRVEHENRLVNQYTARDFTPFRFMNWGEVPSTHMLAFFLDPGQDHGQGALFQELFLARLRKALPDEGRRLPTARWNVEAERRYADYGQLDMLLTTTDQRFGICIENKPRAQTIDQPNQLTSYRALLQGRHQENYLLIYLSNGSREPAPHSMAPAQREELTATGHYINLTYGDFILPLLDDWHKAVHPESLRIFLRQFRYHVEQWMQLESTKPAKLNLTQQIVSTLISTPEYVRAAFTIADSLPGLKRQVLTDFVEKLRARYPDLSVQPHWKDNGFLDKAEDNPLLLRRQPADDDIASPSWGRYAIALAFDGGRLFYGIRFDKTDPDGSEAQEYDWPSEESAVLATLLNTESRAWQSWPWWDWVGPEDDPTLFPMLADGTLLADLEPKIARLREVLEQRSVASRPAQ
jgi:hypothetical protein